MGMKSRFEDTPDLTTCDYYKQQIVKMSQPAELLHEENVWMAKLAEQAERNEEMVEFMEKVSKTVVSEEFIVEECNQLSVAYKNGIGALRASMAHHFLHRAK